MNHLLLMRIVCIYISIVLNIHASDLDNVSTYHLIAATLVLEAGGELDYRSMSAVYEVVVNRSHTRNISLREVVLAPRQFSVWNNPENHINMMRIAKDHPKWEQACLIVVSPPTLYTQGSDHYHTLHSSPSWSHVYHKIVLIGNHQFYRSK